MCPLPRTKSCWYEDGPQSARIAQRFQAKRPQVDLMLMYFMLVILSVGMMAGVTRGLVVGTQPRPVESTEYRQRVNIADRLAENRSAQHNEQNRDHP
jgi:hypothetical protein